jgi:hypothetical protein
MSVCFVQAVAIVMVVANWEFVFVTFVTRVLAVSFILRVSTATLAV